MYRRLIVRRGHLIDRLLFSCRDDADLRHPGFVLTILIAPNSWYHIQFGVTLHCIVSCRDDNIAVHIVIDNALLLINFALSSIRTCHVISLVVKAIRLERDNQCVDALA